MRLTCPNCGAQYEVPDKVIPPQGRDVQCSNCDKSWFFEHPDPLVREDPDLRVAAASFLDDDPADAGQMPQAAPRRKLDPNVSEILKQEAEREARLRSREIAEAEGTKTAPEADAADSARKARARMAHMRGEELAEPASESGPVRQRGVLPDIEEINSTLRTTDDATYQEFMQEKPTRNAGFLRGIALTVLLAAILVLAYVNARTITEAVPQAAPYVKVYVAKIDEGRVWLAGLINGYMPNDSEPLE
ncbi:zinc-ribbon domain-containing protein [Sedimentitalea todarodis]|uniref:Zinc-ribbon domain-containing protein n=1 Tax=Sedimentitalea todarodis TaxID=1631240 RepID=A0ABU3VI08_9RHOB|nr:zinc-ribbon domain-containing protein [Sedimentitalea todarodis]MDU9005826.1 zinc-ribbon domain-containing protein [Sedimentitalea todarodis]